MIEVKILKVTLEPYSKELENACSKFVNEFNEEVKGELDKLKEYFEVSIESNYFVENGKIVLLVPMLVPKIYKLPIYGEKKLKKQVEIVKENLVGYFRSKGFENLNYTFDLVS